MGGGEHVVGLFFLMLIYALLSPYGMHLIVSVQSFIYIYIYFTSPGNPQCSARNTNTNDPNPFASDMQEQETKTVSRHAGFWVRSVCTLVR